jgi:hypothetical protein
MKAAPQAWDADSNLFHRGAAKESHDRDIIAATMAKPGVVLKRPVGSDGPFGEHVHLPTEAGRYRRTGGGHPQAESRQVEEEFIAARRQAVVAGAARAYEREQKHRDREREREEVAKANGA